MTINYARESVIDFTKPFMNLGIGILFKVAAFMYVVTGAYNLSVLAHFFKSLVKLKRMRLGTMCTLNYFLLLY